MAHAERRGVLIPYLTAGYPSLDATVEMAVALYEAGADILELGVPFSDPVADGPVIQRASEAALAAGTTLDACLDTAARIAERVELPIVLFSYYNPLLQYGLDRLANRLTEVNVDGLLVTDLVPEEAGPVVEAMRPRGIDTIFLVAPTSSNERLERIASAASGFIYAVSRTGVTGERDHVAASARALVDRVRSVSDLPIAVGFGVSSPEHVAEIWRFADGAVVGSRLVAEIERDPTAVDLASRVAACASALIPETER